ncbi:MAG TPA: hypothetical protein VGM53_09930 [Streptosporangiaceae bacterium]
MNDLMPGNDDNACRAIAEQINQSRPQWLVVWGLYSRRFWAYPLFEMRPRRLVSAGYPDALIARMDEAERRYRVMPRPEEPTNDDSDDQ